MSCGGTARNAHTTQHKGRSIIREAWTADGSWSLFLRIGNLLTTLATIFAFTRALGPEHFGSWAVLSTVVVSLAFVDLGLGHSLVRRCGQLLEEQGREAALEELASVQACLLHRVVTPLVVGGAMVGMLAWVAGTELLSLSGVRLFAVCLTCGLLAAVMAVLGAAPKARLGLGELRASSALQLSGCAVQVVLVGVLVMTGGPFWVFLVVSFSSQLVGFGLDTAVVGAWPRRRAASVPGEDLRHAGKAFMWLSILGFAGFTLDPVIAGVVLGPTEAGLVALAARVIVTPQSVLSSAFQPRWGHLARLERSDPRAVPRSARQTIALASTLAVLSCVAAGLLADPIVDILAGPGYHLSAALVWSTVAAGCVMGAGAALAVVLNGLGLVWNQLRIAAMSASVNVVASIVLCVSIGVAGAPAATSVSHLLLGVLPAAWVVRRHLSEPDSRLLRGRVGS